MSEFILHVLTHPWHFLTTFGGQLLSGKAVRYVLMMLLPVIVFGRKHWLWLIPGLAMAFLNVMTNNLGQKSGGAHYEFIVLPFLLIAVSLGVARWSRETSRSNWTWMWALLLPLCLAGRGPLFETTDRLAQRGYLVPVAIAVSQWQIPQGTLAADERILPHFNRHPQLRLFHSPEIPLPSSPRESATEILQKNPTRPEHHRGHDFHDATLFALRQNEEWQVFLSNEIKRLGGRVIAEAPMPNGKPFLTLLQLDQPLPQKWCENDYFGFVKGNNCAER